MNVSCPKCNGAIQADIPNAFIQCSFCHSSLFIDLDAITPVYSYEARIRPDELSGYLKRDFEKIGFDEAITIIGVDPFYFPFWQVENAARLERASTRFPNDGIAVPASARLLFSGGVEGEPHIESLTIDSQPAADLPRSLHYIPFYETEVAFNDKHYLFFISASDGNVYGEPLPYIPPEGATRLFYIFTGLFVSMVFTMAFVNNSGAAGALCILQLLLARKWAIDALPGEKKGNQP